MTSLYDIYLLHIIQHNPRITKKQLSQTANDNSTIYIPSHIFHDQLKSLEKKGYISKRKGVSDGYLKNCYVITPLGIEKVEKMCKWIGNHIISA